MRTSGRTIVVRLVLACTMTAILGTVVTGCGGGGGGTVPSGNGGATTPPSSPASPPSTPPPSTPPPSTSPPSTPPPSTPPPSTPPPSTPPPSTPPPSTPTPPPPTPPPSGVAASPTSLTFVQSGAAAAQLLQVAQSGNSATFTESDTCNPSSGAIVTVVAGSTPASYTVTPQHAGSCTITITGTGGASVTVSVGVTITTGGVS